METTTRARIRAGDAVAYGQLFEEHAQAVHRHALRMTGEWAVAEDVVSLTFLEAWRLRAKVDPEGESLRPWLLGIATNVIRNTRRAARRHREAMAKLPPRESLPDIAVELTARMADAEQLAAAKAALARLKPAEREVFALCVWEGLDHAAVAEALGKPVGTIRSRLSRARARLRDLTEKELAAARATRGAALAPEAGPSPEERLQRPGAHGQVTDDRTVAVRPTKETIR
ncbi:Putative sigma factor [Kitasatospora sp. MMS16-BH015]|uniref:RNA polymerase sigma factor n=1 Tax=Kitasatospora sp. MMS16-BH015 TaxID=2018025 RepID=UPI000CA1C9E4|nr:RNA polymerase sigma factor [Kitasatospora sp. MMS16-BH015]AUG76430.1 Putative sigma factor [Kitasatospora sp. MMS16-BH015]